jgi:hypothetical protein
MSVKLEVIQKPKVAILEAMNPYYDYDSSQLDHIRHKCAITIKQSTFERTIDYIYTHGYMQRGHRIRLLLLIEKVLDIFASSGVTYWFLGEVLRDCICFK